jgi:hypothetical protein
VLARYRGEERKKGEMGWFREFLRGGEGSSDQMRAKREQKGEGIVQGTVKKSKKGKALSWFGRNKREKRETKK